MTREEDFKEEGRIAVNKYARELGDYTFGEGSMVEMFIQGAIYADQHPKEGLWDAEKVIEWLQDNADSYTWYDEFRGESGMIDDFIQDLRKAMED